MMAKTTLMFIALFWGSISAFCIPIKWKNKDVVIEGKIIHFNASKSKKTVQFLFRNLISTNINDIYVAIPDSMGCFKISVSLSYPQDFYIKYHTNQALLCTPGDSLYLLIDTTSTKEFFCKVIGGTRTKDNADMNTFVKQIPYISMLDPENVLVPAKYSMLIHENRDDQLALLRAFNQKQQTTDFFKKWAADYIEFGMREALIAYPEAYASFQNIPEDSLKLPDSYYSFLQDSVINNRDIISIKHANFLLTYGRWIQQHPKETARKVKALFKEKQIVKGARILLDMIRNNTAGFIQQLFLTKFYMDAIEGQQLKEFEALYDESLITDLNFKIIINEGYKNLQTFLSNQNTESANIQLLTEGSKNSILDSIKTKYAGKVIYIDFWAPWCTPCMKEMTYSKDLQNHYKNKNIIFLFLANRCSNESWRATIANKKLSGDHIILSDEEFDIMSASFGITGIPHYVLIDSLGNVIYKNALPPSEKENLIKIINKLLP